MLYNMIDKVSTKIVGQTNIEEVKGYIISDETYHTCDDNIFIIKNVPNCNFYLNSEKSKHVIVKSLTKSIIIPDINKIDERYDDVELNVGACIELFFTNSCWYILSSDGMKLV